MTYRPVALVLLVALAVPVAASAQIIESVGERALGMGGAFVAVADDSTATWWNPAAQATGPFIDLSFGLPTTDVADGVPARRETTPWFALATPPFGFSYYHFRATQVGTPAPTGQGGANRQDDGTGVPLRSLAVHQLGATVVQVVGPGIHVGTTLKYVRGKLQSGVGDATLGASDLLDRGDGLNGATASSHFDFDAGVIAVEGPLRVGAVVKNALAPQFDGPSTGGAPATLRLPRIVRAGAAFDASANGSLPLMVSVDADLRTYATGTGDRRVVAVGGEEWFAGHRFGVRAGARFNTVGLEERAATAGASVAVRAGLYVEGHGVFGGSRDEHGWGIGARMSF